ncbi:MAG: ABC transporter substrate-binding protein [Candidatus Binatia bacterium]
MRKLFLIALSALALTAMPEILSAAERSLRVSFSAPATVYLPLWAASDAGFFKKQGLNVEIIHVGSSPIAISALMTNETQVLSGGGTVAPTAYLQGERGLQIFARMNNRFVFSLFSHPSITTLDGLKGKKLGVTRFGGSLEFATRYFLRQQGIDARKDLSMIQLGRVPDIATALIAGNVDAGTVSFPHHLILKKAGYRELADLSQMDTPYATTAFVGRKNFLAENEAQMERFVRALIEAIHYLRSHRTEALKIISRYTRLTDMELLGQDFDFHVQKIWPRVPQIQPEDLKLALEELAERNPKAREIAPADLIYGNIVKNVIASGFADKLYKQNP